MATHTTNDDNENVQTLEQIRFDIWSGDKVVITWIAETGTYIIEYPDGAV